MKKRKTTTMGKFIAISIIGILLCTGIQSVSACYTDLFAGRDQNIVGDVHVRRAGHLFIVTYSTDSDWLITETQLAIATAFEDIPQNKKGSPKIGHFPYQSEHPEGTDFVQYSINLYDYFPAGDWRGNTLYIAAHSVVEHPELGEETAWADTWGQYFPGSSIALFFTFTF